MWKCVNVEMWKCENVEMCKFENEEINKHMEAYCIARNS